MSLNAFAKENIYLSIGSRIYCILCANIISNSIDAISVWVWAMVETAKHTKFTYWFSRQVTSNLSMRKSRWWYRPTVRIWQLSTPRFIVCFKWDSSRSGWASTYRKRIVARIAVDRMKLKIIRSIWPICKAASWSWLLVSTKNGAGIR